MKNEVVIVAAARTAIGKFGGSLNDISAVELGRTVTRSLLDKTDLDASQVNQTIFGMVLQAGNGQNPARQIALGAGIPVTSPAMTVNEVCGSGMKSIQLACQAILLGDADVVVAGGSESMSQAPHLSYQRWGNKAGNITLIDSLFHDGLTDAFSGQAMGVTAENVANAYHINRQEQDEFANSSQTKATKAQEAGYFEDEIVPVEIPGKRGQASTFFASDEGIRSNTNLESLAKLRTVFQTDGSVTAGNSSTINDGAAAVLLMSREKAEELGLKVLARITGYSEVAIEPDIMGVAPVKAIQTLLTKTQQDQSDIDLWEINEAFASQSLAVIKDLHLDPATVNITGGAIALGHPIGASGTRILVTLVHQLHRLGKKQGVASLCVGGGMGLAVGIEVD